MITKPKVPLHPTVNLYHFDCRSLPPKQEFVTRFSGVPTPLNIPWENELPLQRRALDPQSWPGKGGGVVFVTQVEKVPSEEVEEEIV